MRRHGEVPAGKGRRGREVSSLTDEGGAEATGSGGLQASHLKPDNVFSLFPIESHRQSQFSPPRMPPDALSPPAQPKTKVVRPDSQPEGGSENRSENATAKPSGRGRDQDREKNLENSEKTATGQPSVQTSGPAMGRLQEDPSTRPSDSPSQQVGNSVSQQAAPPLTQQSAARPPAAEPPAWTQHPITKALEALHGPGGGPSPTQIIAESLRGRQEGWLPVRPLSPEALQPSQPERPPQPQTPPQYGDLPFQSDGPMQETPAQEMPVEEALGEEAAIAAEAKLAVEQQFWELWLTHQDQLRKQCMHMMSGNLADAEDALSSAMLRASQKFVEYSGSIMNEKAWLSKLVHNVCIDQFRQRKRTYYQALEGEASEQVEEAMFSGPQPSPEEVALGREQVATLEACLEKLSNNLRVPLMLRCVEGWSYPDIAAELDLRADTVRKRVQLARDFLRGRDIR